MNKSNNAYKTIGEVVKILKLESNKKDNLAAHTIRFWEKEFKQLKPKILNGNRRYYDEKSIRILKRVHFLLKERHNYKLHCNSMCGQYFHLCRLDKCCYCFAYYTRRSHQNFEHGRMLQKKKQLKK